MPSPDRVEQAAFLLSVMAAVALVVGAPLLVAQHQQRLTPAQCEQVAEATQASVPQIMALALALIALRRSHDGRPPPT